MRKKHLWIVGLVLAMALGIGSVVLADAKDTFTDVDESTSHYTHINALYEQGIISGFPDGTFKPDDGLRRADVAVMVHFALGEPDGDVSAMTFTDVPSYAQEAVAALSEEGVIHGYSEKTFGSNDIATRAQVAKFLVTAFGLEMNVADQGYTDIEDDAMLSDYVNALGASGISDGYPNGEFGVNDKVRRKDFAAFLDRAMNYDESPNPEVIGIE
ncbi:S-layer homology domain-containing protein [Tenuibacillus multivorans]|uniref:S-layer homology domain-containing protein n=1 Tax=Tenuibacillus multivorans TaxID=237069 RepID=A0A1H0C0C3_9BACI|nr:S-layer homology domain-containing protein [Tenuibacillus multivorans]GEL77714.1 hypothetical protein TMU01_19490 [Tenuibacillus multivorans]SDN51343.1 S-layer homology domain-containing protein [Tenuibacillus multivorans]